MSDSNRSSLDAIRVGEAAARHALANPLPSDTHEPTPATAAPTPGTDPAADAARSTLRPGAFSRPAGV